MSVTNPFALTFGAGLRHPAADAVAVSQAWFGSLTLSHTVGMSLHALEVASVGSCNIFLCPKRMRAHTQSSFFLNGNQQQNACYVLHAWTCILVLFNLMG